MTSHYSYIFFYLNLSTFLYYIGRVLSILFCLYSFNYFYKYITGFLPKLKVLHLSGNPITYPPKSIVEQGLPTIQSFLRNEFKNQTAEKQMNYLTNVNDVSSSPTNYNAAAPTTTDKCLVEMPVVSLKALYKKDQSLRKKEAKKNKLHTANAKLNIYKDTPYSNSNKYLHMLPNRRNVYRISEQVMKDLWMKKLKELMTEQDETLQKEKYG